MSAAGPHDAWAADVPEQLAAGRAGSLVHWNGRSWRPGHPLPAGFIPATVREPVPADLWVFGERSSTGSGREALRWDGASGGLLPIAGSSPSNLWLVSRATVGKQKGQRLIAYRWTGTSWKWVPIPHPRLASLPSVAVTSARSIWISAVGLPRPFARRPELAWHWNGRTLHATGPAPLPVFGLPAPDGLGGLWLGPLQYWTGTRWVRCHLPSCAEGFFPAGDTIARIPGTHSALLAGTCNPGGASSPQAMVAVSQPAS